MITTALNSQILQVACFKPTEQMTSLVQTMRTPERTEAIVTILGPAIKADAELFNFVVPEVNATKIKRFYQALQTLDPLLCRKLKPYRTCMGMVGGECFEEAIAQTNEQLQRLLKEAKRHQLPQDKLTELRALCYQAVGTIIHFGYLVALANAFPHLPTARPEDLTALAQHRNVKPWLFSLVAFYLKLPSSIITKWRTTTNHVLPTAPALSMAEQFDAAFWLSCALLEYTELKVPGFKELSGPNPFAVIDA